MADDSGKAYRILLEVLIMFLYKYNKNASVSTAVIIKYQSDDMEARISG